MKYLLSTMTSVVLVFTIYLGMAYLTKMPQSNDPIEEDNTNDVTYIKPVENKVSPKLNSPSENQKPKQLENPDLLKAENLEVSKMTQNNQIIDRNILNPAIESNITGDFSNLLENNNNDFNNMNPLLPYEAYKNNINGWVLLKLFVSKTGTVFNVEVLDSSPKGMFDSYAVKTAYKKVFPIKKTNLDPKVHTRNLKIKYGADE